ncbi:hypothetical protein PG990_007617 [Apiospora arundinis]
MQNRGYDAEYRPPFATPQPKATIGSCFIFGGAGLHQFPAAAAWPTNPKPRLIADTSGWPTSGWPTS